DLLELVPGHAETESFCTGGCGHRGPHNPDLAYLLPGTVLAQVRRRGDTRPFFVPLPLTGANATQHAGALSVPFQRLLKQLSPAEKPAHHVAHRALEYLGDLFVRKLLQIRQDNDEPEVDWQGVDRPQNIIGKKPIEEVLLGVGGEIGGVARNEALVYCRSFR